MSSKAAQKSIRVLVDVHTATKDKGLERTIQKAIAKTVPFFKKQGVFEFSVALVGERAMRKLAKEWKGKDKATDVLSFGFDGHGHNGFPDKEGGVKRMGELVICVPVAKRQAKSLGIGVRRTIATLASHGTIHLFGLDHERSQTDYDKTMDIQNKVIHEKLESRK
ncbi:rRNA maturation RNase YbeY [Candidatus Azambacteria bacterium RIFCSPHIGHO2_02_FULL_52_12]|uniref:Endoribonuclease YbeY n=1 Tax=Candidatus Azambacteria bacterium RIFCSPLOWO2_01_FULL_46_25 TaxID=1797298 RepID=A0A1F5BU95_9BACT|nr:MAG: rRNA maturation RNase YbeY [Candidatus Azambacteria bacterium RIFCSPHIGHO2_02_FULL_52_12]OGD34167.1 MAG: rRNA maturation RNase YbeY [Candidatus Azambacteria bacterium RIFCSPLOWO2_01_FULL_46_25]OGD37742.1 MAG: rRNA maturation RNase YbeY [Candidatus Azambacteria bacterium RIFCSPHIGHO2_01_FULL_51_74]